MFLLFAFVLAHSGLHQPNHKHSSSFSSAASSWGAAAAAAADDGPQELWIRYGPWLSSRGLVAAAVAVNASRIDFIVCPPTTAIPGRDDRGGNVTRADALIREWLDPTLTDADQPERAADTSAEEHERRRYLRQHGLLLGRDGDGGSDGVALTHVVWVEPGATAGRIVKVTASRGVVADAFADAGHAAWFANTSITITVRDLAGVHGVWGESTVSDVAAFAIINCTFDGPGDLGGVRFTGFYGVRVNDFGAVVVHGSRFVNGSAGVVLGRIAMRRGGLVRIVNNTFAAFDPGTPMLSPLTAISAPAGTLRNVSFVEIVDNDLTHPALVVDDAGPRDPVTTAPVSDHCCEAWEAAGGPRVHAVSGILWQVGFFAGRRFTVARNRLRLHHCCASAVYAIRLDGMGVLSHDAYVASEHWAVVRVDDNDIDVETSGSPVGVSLYSKHSLNQNMTLAVRGNRMRLISSGGSGVHAFRSYGLRNNAGVDSLRLHSGWVIAWNNVTAVTRSPMATRGVFFWHNYGIGNMRHFAILDNTVRLHTAGCVGVFQTTSLAVFGLDVFVIARNRVEVFLPPNGTKQVDLRTVHHTQLQVDYIACGKFVVADNTITVAPGVDSINSSMTFLRIQPSAYFDERIVATDGVSISGNRMHCVVDGTASCAMLLLRAVGFANARLGTTIFNNTGWLEAPYARLAIFMDGLGLVPAAAAPDDDDASTVDNRLDFSRNNFSIRGVGPGYVHQGGPFNLRTPVAISPAGVEYSPIPGAGWDNRTDSTVVHLDRNTVDIDADYTTGSATYHPIDVGFRLIQRPSYTLIATNNDVRLSAGSELRTSHRYPPSTETRPAVGGGFAASFESATPNATLHLWYRGNTFRDELTMNRSVDQANVSATVEATQNIWKATRDADAPPILQPFPNVPCRDDIDCAAAGSIVNATPNAQGGGCECRCRPLVPQLGGSSTWIPRAFACEPRAVQAAMLHGDVPLVPDDGVLRQVTDAPVPATDTATRTLTRSHAHRRLSPTLPSPRTSTPTATAAKDGLPAVRRTVVTAASATVVASAKTKTTPPLPGGGQLRSSLSPSDSLPLRATSSPTRTFSAEDGSASAAADDEASVASPLLESPARLAVAAAAVGAAVVALAGGDTGGEAVGALQNFLVLTQVPCLRRTVLARAGDSGLWLLAPLVLGLSGHAGRVVALLAVMSAALAANGLWALRFRGRADGKMSAAGSAARPAGVRGRFPSLALRVVRLLVPGLGVAAMQGVTGARVGDDDGTSAAGRVAGAAGVAALGALLWWALRACRGARVAAPAEVEAPGGTRAAEAGAVAFGAFAPHPLGARAGRWVGPTGFWLGPAARVAAPIFGGLSPPDALDTSASAAAADANNTGDAAAAGAARCSGLPGRLWWLGPWYTVGRPTLFAALLAADVERLTGQCVCWVQLALFAALFAADAAVDVGLAPLRVRVLNALNGLVSVTSCAVAALEAYGQAGALTCAARPSGSSSSSAGGGGSEALGGTSAEGAHAGGGAEAAELAGAVAALTTVLAVPSNLAMAASVFVMAMERWRWRKAQRRRWRVAAAGAAAAATLSSGDGDNAKAAAAGRGGTAQPLLSVPVVVAPAKGRGEGGRAAAAEGNSRDVRACTTSSGDDAPCEQRSRNPLQQRGDGRSAVEL